MLDLYKNIKKRRQELHMTQTELAEKTGYTNKSSIASIEAGKIDLPQSKILQFADALECTPSELLGWTGDSYSNEEDMVAASYLSFRMEQANHTEVSLEALELAEQWDKADAETKRMIVEILAFAKAKKDGKI